MSHSEQGNLPSPGLGGGAVKDLVCGMDVDPSSAEHRAEHRGQTYYFCSAHCREKFLEDPGRYV